MRKAIAALAVGGVVTALAGCASSGTPQSAAAAGTTASAPGTSPTSAGTPATSPMPTPSDTSMTPTGGSGSSTSTSHRSSSSASPSKSKTTSRPATSSSHPTSPGSVPTSFGYSPTADAKAEIDAARAAAKADGREVLLDFGAGWCGNCVALDASFHTAKVQAELASSYHLVQVDVDVNANMQLLTQYAPSSSGSYGLPVLIILSPSGSTRVDTDKSGNPGFDASSFLAFLQKWAA